MKKLGAALLFYLGLASAALAQTPGGVPATLASVPITGTVAGAAKIISGTSGKSIYLTAISLAPASTSAVTITAGTGTNCGTNTTNLTGTIVGNGSPWTFGSGYGAILVAPVGYDVCITIATATAPGSIAYAKY
jgi:hypothetical protein